MTRELITHEDELDKFLASERMQFLKFGDGEWRLGKDSEEIPPDRKFCVLIGEPQTEWILWGDGKVVKRVSGHVDRTELGHNDKTKWPISKLTKKACDPWQLQISVILVDEDGTTVRYATSSRGGSSALCALGRAYKARGRKMVPVVTLSSKIEKAKKSGDDVYYAPVFKIAAWADPCNFAHITEYGPDEGDDGSDDDVRMIEDRTPLSDIIDDDIPF
jgi:hypothetical protein